MVQINWKQNLNKTKKADEKTAKPALAYNKIHDVKLLNVERKQFVSAAGKSCDIMNFKFGNESGELEHTIFKFKPEDCVDKQGTYTNPPSYLNSIFIISNLLSACDPALEEEFEQSDFPSELNAFWDAICKFVVEKTESYVKEQKVMQVKAFGRVSNDGTIKSDLHSFIYNYNKENELYNKYGKMIGHNLGFNNAEKKLIANFEARKAALGMNKAAKPTGLDELAKAGVSSNLGELNKPTADKAFDDINIDLKF